MRTRGDLLDVREQRVRSGAAIGAGRGLDCEQAERAFSRSRRSANCVSSTSRSSGSPLRDSSSFDSASAFVTVPSRIRWTTSRTPKSPKRSSSAWRSIVVRPTCASELANRSAERRSLSTSSAGSASERREGLVLGLAERDARLREQPGDGHDRLREAPHLRVVCVPGRDRRGRLEGVEPSAADLVGAREHRRRRSPASPGTPPRRGTSRGSRRRSCAGASSGRAPRRRRSRAPRPG